MRTVVLVDAGWLKYSTRFAAKSRLGLSNDAPFSQMVAHPSCFAAIYDVMAASIKSRLSQVAKFCTIDRCIFCMDIGQSWRTTIPKTKIPGTNEDSSIEYKGHRKVEDPTEIDAIVKLNDMYKKCIEYIADNGGIDLVGHQSIEADDFMIILSKLYADQGDLVFVVSRDADITQAVYTSEFGGRVIIYQPNPNGAVKLVCNHETRSIADKTGIFDMSMLPQELLVGLRNSEVVAPQYVVATKILLGDVADDISPVMMRISGTRHYKLRQKDLQSIFEYFSSKNSEGYFTFDNLYDDNDIRDILRIAHKAMFKTDFNSLTEDWQNFYVSKFKENRQMVLCTKQEIGEDNYNTIVQCALEQLTTQQPHVDTIPSWDVLQRLRL